jgi:hypothetical protein
MKSNIGNKQSGFIEFSIISALVVFVSIMIVIMKYSDQAATKTQAEKGAENFKAVVAASMSWYQDRGSFPGTTANLVPQYMSAVAQKTPWGEPITLTSTATTLTVQTNTNGQPNSSQLAGFMAGIIPLAEQSGAGRRVVSATYGKPGTEPALDALVHRDGSRTLTGEWDVGGQGISNIKDMSISGINRTVVSGLAWSAVQKNSQPVELITCPPGKKSKITTTPVSYSKNGFPFKQIGAVEGVWDGNVAYVRIWESDDAGQGWYIPSPDYAYIRVEQQCGN